MKIKYLAALAAASVVGMTAITGCAGDTTTEDTAPDAAMEEPMEESATMEEPAEPCAAE